MIDQVRNWISHSQRTVVLTGAGISAESGIPTFRGPGGLWRNYRPEDLATPEAFSRDPLLVWQWYDWRRVRIAQAEPNSGHTALVTLERQAPHFTLVTQNVDGLHQRAGSERVLAIHGDIWTVRCTRCDYSAQDFRTPLSDLPPRCRCGALLRPGVVWFGEGLPAGIWEEAQRAARSAGLFLIVGTSAVVYPAASLAPLAKAAGARVVEINPDPTPLSASVDCSLRSPAGEALTRLIATRGLPS